VITISKEIKKCLFDAENSCYMQLWTGFRWTSWRCGL